MKYSIIIPNYNNSKITRNLVNEINNLDSDLFQKIVKNRVNFEILIIDDGSSFIEKRNLNSYLKSFSLGKNKKNIPFEILENIPNQGFAVSCNKGAQKAKGNWLIFINNDISGIKDIFQKIPQIIKKKEAGVIGANLFYPNGFAQHLGIVFSDDYYPFHFGAGNITKEEFKDNSTKTRSFQAISAAFMIVKKNEFISLNGFDEKYKNGMEDIDFCLRYRKKYKNKNIIIPCEFMAYHLESQSRGRYRHNAENEKKFFATWKSEFGKFIISDWLRKSMELDLIKYFHREKPPYFVFSGEKWGQFSWLKKKLIKTLKIKISGMRGLK